MPNVILDIKDARAVRGAIGGWLWKENDYTKSPFDQETNVANMHFTMGRLDYEIEKALEHSPAVTFWTPGDTVEDISNAINMHTICSCDTDEGWERCLFPRWVEYIEYALTADGTRFAREDKSEYDDAFLILPTLRELPDGEDD